MEIPSEQPEMTTMEFVCRDTGIGMAEEFQKHIFEPFAQEHAGTRITNVVPMPSALSKVIVPPIFSINFFEIGIPRPVPENL